ncbi:MAG TPA: CDP-diacylglycerol--glycerol-3-phosphate 3-phosphatidyltransferase [Caulobacteraceae bacterium]
MTEHRIRNSIPNVFTGVRLFGGVVMFLMLVAAAGGAPFVSEYLSPEQQFALYQWAFVIFAASALTDWIDGFLARRWNAVSRWGAILDPIADKILVAGGIVGILTSGTSATVAIPLGLILFREFAVSALRETTAGSISLPVTFLAKCKTALQMIALGLQIFILAASSPVGPMQDQNWVPQMHTFADVLVWLAAFATIWTGVEYFLIARKKMITA